jgi:hypothetical protein
MSSLRRARLVRGWARHRRPATRRHAGWAAAPRRWRAVCDQGALSGDTYWYAACSLRWRGNARAGAPLRPPGPIRACRLDCDDCCRGLTACKHGCRCRGVRRCRCAPREVTALPVEQLWVAHSTLLPRGCRRCSHVRLVRTAAAVAPDSDVQAAVRGAVRGWRALSWPWRRRLRPSGLHMRPRS